jgi:CxxC-x17-CxxC domain-containing protein
MARQTTRLGRQFRIPRPGLWRCPGATPCTTSYARGFPGLDAARIVSGRFRIEARSEEDGSRIGERNGTCDPQRAEDHAVFEDRTLTCRDCGDDFIFSGGEQRFFSEKGLQNVPQRCPSCRANAKRVRMGGPREYHAAVCNACGNQAMVPFAPRTDRPVYCSSCFDKVRAGLIPAAAAPVST